MGSRTESSRCGTFSVSEAPTVPVQPSWASGKSAMRTSAKPLASSSRGRGSWPKPKATPLAASFRNASEIGSCKQSMLTPLKLRAGEMGAPPGLRRDLAEGTLRNCIDSCIEAASCSIERPPPRRPTASPASREAASAAKPEAAEGGAALQRSSDFAGTTAEAETCASISKWATIEAEMPNHMASNEGRGRNRLTRRGRAIEGFRS
mmetsp:Transcript_98823/g.258156  ORF Transcript_98823/g.258156 Transcript_98823/m.258156 type:complete len:206 (-) Transcript_98823:19-636(-)